MRRRPGGSLRACRGAHPALEYPDSTLRQPPEGCAPSPAPLPTKDASTLIQCNPAKTRNRHVLHGQGTHCSPNTHNCRRPSIHTREFGISPFSWRRCWPLSPRGVRGKDSHPGQRDLEQEENEGSPPPFPGLHTCPVPLTAAPQMYPRRSCAPAWRSESAAVGMPEVRAVSASQTSSVMSV